MKRILALIMCAVVILSGCTQKGKPVVPEVMEIGDEFSITGAVDYSDKPSDIGQEYCFITIDEKIEYNYIDIYDKVSKWSSDVFYTKGNDTELLKEYVGQKVKVSGTFDAESHGIPYITNITVED